MPILAAAFLAFVLLGGAAAEDLPPRLRLAQLHDKYASPADQTIDIEGMQVVYRDEGRGPAILLIHGSNSTLRSYDAVARILSRRYRVIRYDVPPYGLSGPVRSELIGRVRPSDIPARILAKLGVQKVTAAGASSGGTIATFLAAEHPALVARVVISNAPSDPVDMSKLQRSPALAEAERIYGGYLDSTRIKPRAYWRTYTDFYSGGPGRFSDTTINQMFDFARRVPEPNDTAMIAVVADQTKAVAAWSAVHVPVLLLWGGSDPLLPAAAAGVLAGHLVNADVSTVILPDVSHYPPTEVPARYAAILAAYIEQVTPSGAPH